MRDLAGSRRDRAWGLVNDHLSAELYGASTMAVTDRLLRAGYTLDEATRVLHEMRETGLVDLRGGHWVLRSGAKPSPGPQAAFVSWQ